jgi:hypothetical protein
MAVDVLLFWSIVMRSGQAVSTVALQVRSVEACITDRIRISLDNPQEM